MTELSSMYSYLKGISENQSPDFNEMNYLLPRPLNDTYLIPPTARPINSSASSPSTSSPQYTNIDCYQIPPSPVSIAEALDYHIPPLPLPFQSSLKNCQVLENTSNSLHTSHNISPTDKTLKDTYLEMNSTNNPGSANNIRQHLRLKLNHNHYQNFKADMNLNHSLSSESISGSQNLNNHRISSSSSTTSTNGKQSVHGAQDELVEIINDFKNNVFTISEVEKLVENWQNRHDVQQSFKEKQEQLNQMREEYERIQKNMKEQLKRPTPFEKIRKFFSRKSKGPSYNEECKLKDNPKMPQINNSLSSHRPVSSLSLQSSCSSSSSGHLSTGSGTSLGDSGTHSDSEERKINQTLKFEKKAKMSSANLCTEVSQSTLADQKLQIAENNLNCDLTKCEQTKNQCFTSMRNSSSLEDKILELEEFQKPSLSKVSIERDTVLLEKQKSDQTTEEIAVTLSSTDKNICIETKEFGIDQSEKKSQCNKLFFLGNESNENGFEIDGLSPIVCACHSSDLMTSLSSTISDFPELKTNNSLTDEISSKKKLGHSIQIFR
uniref:Uncharacterized protein n=1 Tax=Clastoptera arizonana TaxID=38151 RepID=A0A1B6DX99_9HEMI